LVSIKKHWLLVLVLLVAGFLRFYRLGSNPPALSWDEAAWGYNAYSLGLTGADEFGRRWPLDYLESFGDFKPPVYAYLTILPVKFFGLNEFSTRFASAFFGILTVLVTYWLVGEVFPAISPRRSAFAHHPRCLTLPLIASFLLAISPWHIMLSRAAFEANIATFFIVAGVTTFLAGIRKNNWLLLVSATSFALGLHTFNTARVVAPILVLGLVITFRRQLWQQKKQVVVAAAAGLLVILPAINFWMSPQAKLRFKEVNIFSDLGIVRTANQEMANDQAYFGTLPWWSTIIHNRRWGYARQYIRHYFDHFNPAFLFFKGDGNPKFSTQDVGQLYLWELPFLVWGCLMLFRKKKGYWWLVPFWLLAGIIPAATARETPHALRIEATLPTWQILTALGVVAFWQWLQKQRVWPKRILLITFYLSLVANFVYFQHGYWRHYPVEFAGEWEYGYQPAIDFVKQVEADYDEIWFTDKIGRPYIFFLFYFQKDPLEFRQQAQIARDVFGFVEVESFNKYHFFREKVSAQGRALIFDDPGRIPAEAVIVKTICLPNGKEVLKAYEI